MGEISRHYEIYRNTFEQIKQKYAKNQYTFVELGNFLTDISQFRDPYANFSAKKRVWEKAPIIIRNIVGFDLWIDDLFGKPEKRYGHLADYFFNICRGITHMAFSDDIPKKNNKDNAFYLNHLFANLEPVPAKDVDEVFYNFFTQYYPHEHLDMPDFYLLNGYKSKNEDKDYDIGTTNLYRINGKDEKVGLAKYLGEQIEFIAEELSEIEQGISDNNLSPQQKRDLFVRLGKTLHPIEDYFFHSNYVELNLFNYLKNSRSSAETDEEYLYWFYKRALEIYNTFSCYKGSSDDYNKDKLLWQRKLIRRMRFPLFEKNTGNELGAPDKTDSLESLNKIYTGGFGSNDMFHTMISALENIEKMFSKSWGILATNSTSQEVLDSIDLVLIKTFFNMDYRTELGKDESKLSEAQALHLQQVQGDDYINKINEIFEKGFLNQQARESFLIAIDIDRQFQKEYSLISGQVAGVGGFLIEFLVTSQKEVNESGQKISELAPKEIIIKNKNYNTDELQNNPNIKMFDLDLPTDNGASAEEIGNHTLMAKDTPKSQPLYEDANFLAKYASLTVASFIFDKKYVSDYLNGTIGISNGSKLDWKNILRQLLRYPMARNSMWETELLLKHRQKNTNTKYGKSSDDKVVLADVSNNKIKPVFQGLVRMPLHAKKKSLEEKYRMLEKVAQKQYKPTE